MHLSYRASSAIAVCIAMVCSLQSASSADSPNFLVIMADDLGYGDLGCTGSESIKTPHIDQLAASGTVFTQAYVASAVCSPSRAGFMTGRDPRRFGYEGNLNSGAENYATRPELLGLPTTEHTLGDQLKKVGYRTGIVGKWHLGLSDRFHPNNRGFDYFCGMRNGGHDYFPRQGKNRIERNGEPVKEFSSPYLTDFFSDEAVRWIEKPTDKPWFLFLSYNAPHTPMQATEADLKVFAHIKDNKRQTYAAMVHAMDRGIGRVLAALDQTEQTNNTFVVFLSDNGGATNNGSWNGNLSGAKGSLLEGGIRVPMIWRWPARVPTGKQSATVVSSLDLLPTFLAAADASPLPLNPPASHEDARNCKRMLELCGQYDGINVMPLIAENAQAKPQRDPPLFWRLQGQAAMLQGEQKLIRLSHRPAQLFHPASDPGEQADLAPHHPAELQQAFKLLGSWEAALPTVPLWDSSPYWHGDSAKIYDTWQPRPEPK